MQKVYYFESYNAAITLSNEVLFAMLDMAGEYKTADEIGKQLATSAVTSAISVLGAGAGAAVSGLSGIGGVLAKTGVSAATSVTSTVTVNAIQSDGDWDRFSDSMKSFDTWKGCISSTAGSLVTNSLGAVNSYDANGIALSGKVFDTSSIGKLNSLAGGLASTAVTYGLTGEATFNVLNIADFINPNSKLAGASSGLLEVTLGGEKGFSSRIGTGGTDISSSSLLGAVKGMNEASKVTDWKYGSDEQRSTLNAINMLGYTQVKTKENDNIQLAKDIWNGELGVEYGDTGEDYGNYKVGDDKIKLSNKLLGGGKEESAKLAAVMSHEGTHAYGNRVEGVAHYAADQTYSQINSIFKLKGDVSFSDQMLAGILDTKNWKENEGDVDHWRIVYKNDGSIGWEWDKDFNFNFEDGSSLTPEEMKEYIQQIKQKREMEKNGTKYSDPKATSTHAESVIIGALKDYIKNNLMNPSAINLDKVENFIFGTESFADASIGAKNASELSNEYEKLKAEGKRFTWKESNEYEKNINSSMDLMFSGLYNAQESGLLVKNPYNTNSSKLNGDGLIDSPYLSLTGTVYDTCDQGIRFVTEDFYNKLKPADRANFPLMGFAKNDHLHTDLVSYDSDNVVTSVDGAIALTYSNTWGFSGINYSSESDLAFLSNHLASSSIKQYINVFGMEGTSLQSSGNNSYVLAGVNAGTTYATMGNTGISAGNHVDFGIYQINKPYNLNMYSDTRLNFKDVYKNYTYFYKQNDKWTQNYSGLTSRFLLDPSNSTVLDTYIKYYQNKYNTDMNYWKKINGWY